MLTRHVDHHLRAEQGIGAQRQGVMAVRLSDAEKSITALRGSIQAEVQEGGQEGGLPAVRYLCHPSRFPRRLSSPELVSSRGRSPIFAG